METKTYFAASVPSALEVARQELGPDAVLISSRPSLPDVRHFGRVEVTFGFVRREATAAGVFAGERETIPEPANPDLADIRRQLQALRAVVGSAASGVQETEETQLLERLTLVGLDSAVARDITKRAAAAQRQASQQPTTGDWWAMASTALAGAIPTSPFVELKAGESRTLAFIGPPGRGKTTSLVKIALAHGLSRRVPVRLCSTGTQVIGAHEQITRYAGILGTPLLCFESFQSLLLAMNGEPWKGLTLIDTAGISPADQAEVREAEAFFASREGRPAIEKHLVLRADSRSADNLNVIARFASLQPSRLLFTGLDEASNLVPVIDTLIRSGLPLSFTCEGQQIPTDLRAVKADDAVRMADSVIALARRISQPQGSEGSSGFAAAA